MENKHISMEPDCCSDLLLLVFWDPIVASQWSAKFVLFDELLEAELSPRIILWSRHSSTLMLEQDNNVTMVTRPWLRCRTAIRLLVLTSVDSFVYVASRNVHHQPMQPLGDRRILPRQIVWINHDQRKRGFGIDLERDSRRILQIPDWQFGTRFHLNSIEDHIQFLLWRFWQNARNNFRLWKFGCNVRHLAFS